MGTNNSLKLKRYFFQYTVYIYIRVEEPIYLLKAFSETAPPEVMILDGRHVELNKMKKKMKLNEWKGSSEQTKYPSKWSQLGISNGHSNLSGNTF